MKHILVLFVSILSLTTTFGQLEKNTWLIGGNGSFYSYNENFVLQNGGWTGKYTSIDLTASIGYFLTDKFSAGIRPLFSSYKGESSGGAIPYDLKFAVGPFARYYFLKSGKQFNILTDVGYLIGTNQGRHSGMLKGKYNIFTAMSGVEVFFNSTVGIEILLGYKNQLLTLNNGVNDATNSNQKGFQTSIGFQLHLSKN